MISFNQFKPGSFVCLQAIHKYLFQNKYDSAGEIRCSNIVKDNFRFVSVIYLYEAIKIIEKMPQNNFDEILKKYIEMYVAHPFLYGNDRSLRIWLNIILSKKLGVAVDWNKINQYDCFSAMERSVIKDLEIKTLLKSALINKTNFD